MRQATLDSDQLITAIRARLLAALPLTGADDLPEALPRTRSELERFRLLMRDYPERAGKCLRGQIVVLAAAAHGADDRAALVVAAAIELFQAWVLVHDDIEDDSETRRSLPALHRLVGMPVALNVGDALHVRMWRLLHRLVDDGFPHAAAVIAEFGSMIERTAEGQHLDLAYLQTRRTDVSEPEYLDMVARKTATYTVVSPLRLGALLAGREPHADLAIAGEELGVAFQIRDDVLNLRPQNPSREEYGKEFAGDLYEGKRTLILAHMLAAASDEEREAALAILARSRDERSPREVRTLLDSIERHGSLEYAQRVADGKASSGLGRLREALAPVPGRAAADALLELLAGVAQRDA